MMAKIKTYTKEGCRITIQQIQKNGLVYMKATKKELGYI